MLRDDHRAHAHLRHRRRRGSRSDVHPADDKAELRWDISPRWTLVGFAGVGWVAEKCDEIDDADDQWAGGTGFRYLIARQYDLYLGCDVARGPDEWAFYVTIGTGWLRD